MPQSNSTMIWKLQVALNSKGCKILSNRSQFYSEQQKRPVTKYIVSQSRKTPSGKNRHVELFSSYSQIQIVLFMRNLWYLINNKPIPETNHKQIKEILTAYDHVSVTFENGEYHYGGDCIKATYASDYEVIGEYRDYEIYTEKERIINYVESFHDYPSAYKGKRDYKWLKSLGYDWDIKVKFDENGNLVTKE